MAYTAIDDAGSFFSQKNFEGTSSELVITGVGFQPDMNWTKDRDQAGYHVITDSARGATKTVFPDRNAIETTYAQGLKSFDSDGFTLGTDGTWNQSGDSMASWNWKAGTTSGIATNGSTTITPSAYTFNQTSGISCLKYTANYTAGDKLAHGLGAIPSFIMIKNLDATNDWVVFFEELGNTKYFSLNETAGAATSTTIWNDTSPDSVNITLGTSGGVNYSSEEYVAYCFASVQGYSLSGKYTGNNNANGTVVYTGFKPSMLIVKRDSSMAWVMYNPTEQTYNEIGYVVFPDSDAAEGSNYKVDFLANGFKFRDTAGNTNASATYYYMAFAKSPFVNSNGVPNNAR